MYIYGRFCKVILREFGYWLFLIFISEFYRVIICGNIVLGSWNHHHLRIFISPNFMIFMLVIFNLNQHLELVFCCFMVVVSIFLRLFLQLISIYSIWLAWRHSRWPRSYFKLTSVFHPHSGIFQEYFLISCYKLVLKVCELCRWEKWDILCTWACIAKLQENKYQKFSFSLKVTFWNQDDKNLAPMHDLPLWQRLLRLWGQANQF